MYGDWAPPLLITAFCELGTYGILLQKRYQSGLDVVTNIKIHKFCNIQEQFYYFLVPFFMLVALVLTQVSITLRATDFMRYKCKVKVF